MDQIDLRAATTGLVAGTSGSFAVAVLLGLGGTHPALVHAVADLGVMVLVGALVAVLQRRRYGLWNRRAALRTALTAGGAGLVLVLVLGASAAAAQGAAGLSPVVILLDAAVWLGGTAAGAALVRPGGARELGVAS